MHAYTLCSALCSVYMRAPSLLLPTLSCPMSQEFWNEAPVSVGHSTVCTKTNRVTESNIIQYLEFQDRACKITLF